MEYPRYSVLMSVYYKEKAANLKAALDSIWEQTAKTDDLVLVCDGALTDELNKVIADAEKKHPHELHIVRLEKNGGLGNALNIGIKCCKNELVARMDSDDISRRDRCERQIRVFIRYPAISICSGTVEEFRYSTGKIEARRVLPAKSSEILSFAKKRNPFNHPCVMYKKSAVESAGGYRDFYLLEDYYLWVRMLQKGFSGYNIRKPLLWMRAGSDMYMRRSGIKYAGSQAALFRYMRDSGFIDERQYIISVIVRWISAVISNRLRMLIYRSALRK